jgi:hypothetical protein
MADQAGPKHRCPLQRVPDLKTLMANIAALGDLLDGLKAPQKCSVDHQGRPLADEHGKPLGKLQLLKRLMETHYPAAVPHAEMLLTIRDARNGWPTHSQSRIVATFKSLSIDYPPHDFTYAWRQMMANLHRSLKGIREAMQRGRVDPSEPAGEA